MEKKDIVAFIELHRAAGKRDTQLLEELMPKVSHIYSEKEILRFLNKTATPEMQKKYKLLNNMLLFSLALFGTIALLLQSISIFSLGLFPLLLITILYLGITLYVANRIRNFQQIGYELVIVVIAFTVDHIRSVVEMLREPDIPTWLVGIVTVDILAWIATFTLAILLKLRLWPHLTFGGARRNRVQPSPANR